MTIAEAMLWQELKQKKMLGMDFDRQKPILNYIVDFYCKDLMLAIEVDGGSHDSKQEADSKRQKEMESIGVFFLRFREQEIRKDIVNVMYAIQNWIEEEMKHNGLRGRSAE